MRLAARGVRGWRARSRTGVALVVLTAWFGTLLVAAPLAASAAPATVATTPVMVSGPPARANNASPTWTFDLPADSQSGPVAVTPPPPGTTTSTSDTATATIAYTHRPKCVLSVTAPAGPASYAICGTAGTTTGDLTRYSYTGGPLADGAYSLYLHDEQTATTTTTTYHVDGSPPTVTIDPNPAVTASADVSPAPTYTYDGTPPTLTFTGQPASPGTTTTPVWTFAAGTDAVTVACSFSDGTTITTPACTTSYSPTLTANGTYTLTVTAKDDLGNAKIISSSYTLQTASAPAVTVAPATGTTVTPTWTITPPAGTQPTSYSVVLTGPGMAPNPAVPLTPDATFGATYTPTLSPATNGGWTLSVTATVSGRASAAGTSTYTLDTVNPTVKITPASSSTINTSPTPGWTVAVSDATATTVTCSVTPATPALTSCAGAATWTAGAQGPYTLTATATDAAGNVGTDSSSYTYELPPAAPVIVTPPTGNGPTVTWTVSTQSTATLACSVTGPNFTATSTGPSPAFTCSPGSNVAVTVTLPLSPGVDGNYFLTVTATDPGGSTTTTSTAYVLDRTPPTTPAFATSATVYQNVPGVSWPYTANGGTVTCRLVRKDLTAPSAEALSAVESPCPASPYATNLPTPGEWWLRVTVTDAATNTSTADGPHVVYDVTSPDAPTVTRTSTSPTSSPATTWTLATTETSGFTFLCTWSGPAGYSTTETACPANYSFTLPATNGVYTLNVVVRDAAGNRSLATPGSVTFDNAAPVVTFINPPATPRRDPTVTWTTTVNETSVKTECQLVKRTSGSDLVVESWTTASCGRSVTRTLMNGDGLYFLQVRDTDAAGNVNPVGTSSADVLLDTAPPGPPTVTGSSGYSQNRNASWTVTPAAGQTDPTITYLCRLVKDDVTTGTTWVSCDTDTTTPEIVFTTILPADGTYRLDVVATDPAGNLSAPVATGGPYTLDRVPPPAPTVSTTAAVVNGGYVSNNAAPVWTITGEVGATFTCTWTTTGTGGTPPNGPCADGYKPTLPADGSYTLSVTQTDRALNTSLTATTKTYTLDRLPPAAPTNIVGSVTGTANTLSGSYTFNTDPGTVSCRLLYMAAGSAGPAAPVGSFFTCSSPWPVSYSAGDGNYQLQLHVTDAAGNIGPDSESAVYTLDTTGPAKPIFLTGPTGTARNKLVSWTWSGEARSTGLCTLYLTPVGSTVRGVVAGPVACNGFAYSTTLTYGDGTYELTVQLTDEWTNPGTPETSAPYTLDATAPAAPTVSGPTGTSNKTAADYAITSPVEANATTQCLLFKDGAQLGLDFSACTMPRTIDLAGDGSYVLQVRLTDQYGNVGLPGSSPAYLLDTKLPTVPVVTAPASPSSNAAPVFSIVTDADTKTTCKLTRGSVVAADTAPCSGSFTGDLTGLPDGDYVLTVVATDPAGNTATGSSSPYIYDTTKPLPPSVTGPAGPSQLRNPIFSWTGEAGTTAECSLQEKAGSAGPWTACATPYAPTLPTDGSWVLSVRLIDAARNISDTGASGAYVFDTTPPATPVVTAPTSPGRDLAPSWSASVEDGSKTECRFTGPGQLGSWGPCTLPLATPITTDGQYTFEVRTTDAAGNLSLPGSGTYLLDTVAPGAPVVTQPSGPGRSRNPAISFMSEANTTGSCKLTRGPTVLSDSAPCTSPASIDLTGLSDGAYTLSIRAVDLAGNVGPAGTATYVLDTTAPVAPNFTLIPGSPSSDRAPTFAFNTESGVTDSCKVTTPSGAVKDIPCAGTVSLDLSSATDGDYVLAVRATDPAGNVSAAATTTYQLDSNAPVAPKVVGPTSPGSIRNPVWKISSASPAECRLVRGTTVLKDWSACGTSYAADLFSQPDGVYTLEARVIGTTAATVSRYRLDTAGPAAAAIVGPPSPSTDRKPTWAVSSADATAKAECRVLIFTGLFKDWAPCAVSTAGSLFTLDLTGLGDGTYTLVVRLTDAAGNLGPNASSDYVLDTSAPAAVGVIAPLSPGNDTTPTWTLTSAAGVKLECRVTSGQKLIADFAPCSGTYTADLTGLPDGTYTLTVHALSAAGTPGPETTSGYILDTTAAGAPGTLSGPAGPSRNRAPTWTFTLAPGTTAVCTVTLLGKVYRDGPCTSPYMLDLSNAPDGTYTLTVRAVDSAGNLGSPSTAGYILKTTPPPAPTLTMTPGSPSSTTDPSWGFSLFRGTTAQCRLLQAGRALEDWTACTSPTTALLAGKPDGVYTMQVRAIDVAGNTSAAVSSDYTFDRSAQPLAIFLETPVTPSNDTSPTWVVAAPAATTTISTAPALIRAAALTGTPQTECRLTSRGSTGTWAPCSGRYTATTNGDGTYLLEVRAYDAAGARGPASASSYLLDTRSPAAPRFTDPIPPAVGNDPEVSWSWAEDEDLVECRLMRGASPAGPFTACTPPYIASFARTGEATYSIEARAVDAAGNVSPVSSASYRYDITAPAAPIFTSRPPAQGTAGSASWTFAVLADTSAVCVVSRNGTVVSEGACAGAYSIDLRGQQPATWTLSVHLVDSAGNVGPSTVGSYVLTAVVSRNRVDPVVGGGGGNPTGPGAGPGGGAGAVPGPGGGTDPSAGPASGDPNAGAPRPGGFIRVPEVIKKGVKEFRKALPRIPGAVPGTDVPNAIKNVLGQTITKPQLPLALLLIVLLFLLVQNRIDRRDPKLAAAPMTAEPELSFGPILRPGGATA